MKNILVVDDSALTRRALCDIINSDERFHVQDKAADGIEALELLSVNKYDAVVLDINMPRMGGLELLRELQELKIPAQVLIISSCTARDAQITIDALDLGALEFVQKPGSVLDCRMDDFRVSLLDSLAVVADSKSPIAERTKPKFVEKTQAKAAEKPQNTSGTAEKLKKASETAEKLKKESEASIKTQDTPETVEKPQTVSRARLLEKLQKNHRQRSETEHLGISLDIPKALRHKTEKKTAEPLKSDEAVKTSESKQSGQNGKPQEALQPKALKQDKYPCIGGNKVVAIASSTGGPKALQAVIPKLPANLNAPVVLVQHMPEGFTHSLAERLDYLSEISVKEAEEGDVLKPGVVYLARGGKHLNVVSKAGRAVIHYTDEPNREGVKPCANYMYESLTDSEYEQVVCVVMTGMGADGTKGIIHLKEKKELYVIAQEASTCAVYGMPRSIVTSGLADKVIPLEQIAQEIIMNVGVK